MRFAVLLTIVLIAIAINMKFPPIPLLSLYGFLIIAPLMLIILKKNLLNGLFFWFFFVLFNELGRIDLPLLPAISPDRIIWLALFFLFFAEIGLKQRKFVAGNMRIELAMILFFVVALFSMIQAGNLYKEGEGFQISLFLNSYVFPFSIFFIGKQIVDDEQKTKKVLLFFSVIGFYLGITGVFEHFRLDSLVFPSFIMNPFKGISWGRVRGPFLHAGVNGMVLNMIIFITIYLLFQSKKKWTKIYYSISCTLMSVSILFTYTRAVWLGFIISLSVFTIFLKQTRRILLISFLALFFILFIRVAIEQFAPPTVTPLTAKESQSVKRETQITIGSRAMNIENIYSRINLYATMGRMFLERPILGFGLNTFKENSPRYFRTIKGIPFSGEGKASHNAVLVLLVELGLVGFSLFVFILFYILKISIELYHELPREGLLGKGLVVVFWGVFISFFVKIQFGELRYFPFPSSFFFLMSGIIAGLYQRVLLNKSITA